MLHELESQAEGIKQEAYHSDIQVFMLTSLFLLTTKWQC